MSKLSLFLTVLFCTCTLIVHSKVYYVAPAGNDSHAGTVDAPFLTIQRAHTDVAAGDTVYIRGGTYMMQESQIFEKTTGNPRYAYVSKLTKSGTSGKRINYWAFPGEKPIFDFSNVKPADHRIHAFEVTGSWMHFKGLEVVGVQVTIDQNINTQSVCFSNNANVVTNGSNNIYEQLVMRDGMAIGFYLTRGANNLVLNCDAYNNWDTVSADKKGGNVDGFGAHPNRVEYTGNVFRGCRAWFNSDDGFDIISSHTAITVEDCWSFYNGYSIEFENLANGTGFKMGGFGTSSSPSVPAVIPRHTVRNSLAYNNKSSGFYANHHLGGNDWYNNTAYFNWPNFNMLNRSPNYTASIPGYDHVMKNNVSYLTRSDREHHLITEIDEREGVNILSHNTFMNPGIGTPTAADFISLDQSQLTLPRKPNGDLPDVTFMVPAPGSKLVGAGIDVGLPFTGSSPDLGYRESQLVLSVKPATVRASAAYLYPVPANKVLNIHFPDRASKPVTISIFDLQGRKVSSTEIAATNALAADVSRLPDGIYFLEASYSGTNVVFSRSKFLKRQ
ncbi:right-handed parallel beta-helix repeat-containing protein [Pontibacter qinzhouensis]|uniref:right-handed parallel beta-helix repeat-containing protein n=1 Tax=Pontibacter qinzhouensis TaxID=2603253 RepID=UPI00164EDA87|nr:T9SS type A sorting domain-containing protein [Pontibacter qinzhouensis]